MELGYSVDDPIPLHGDNKGAIGVRTVTVPHGPDSSVLQLLYPCRYDLVSTTWTDGGRDSQGPSKTVKVRPSRPLRRLDGYIQPFSIRKPDHRCRCPVVTVWFASRRSPFMIVIMRRPSSSSSCAHLLALLTPPRARPSPFSSSRARAQMLKYRHMQLARSLPASHTKRFLSPLPSSTALCRTSLPFALCFRARSPVMHVHVAGVIELVRPDRAGRRAGIVTCLVVVVPCVVV